MSLERMIANLKRRKCGKFVLHTSVQKYATCEDFLKELPKAQSDEFTEYPTETVIPLLRWACEHDMAYEERVLDSQTVDETVADFVAQTDTESTRYFLNVTPCDNEQEPRPWSEWTNVLGATFEFAVVALFPEGNLLLVIQDED
jgi:hypothetical protein